MHLESSTPGLRQPEDLDLKLNPVGVTIVIGRSTGRHHHHSINEFVSLGCFPKREKLFRAHAQPGISRIAGFTPLHEHAQTIG